MRGPTVKTQKSCYECEFCTSKHYAVQSDSGCTVDCAHPTFASPRPVGDTVWDTPIWCPEELTDGLPRLSEADEALGAQPYLIGHIRELERLLAEEQARSLNYGIEDEARIDAALAGESAALERVAELEARIEQVQGMVQESYPSATRWCVLRDVIAILAPSEEE